MPLAAWWWARVIIISLNYSSHTTFDAKRNLLRKAGFIAGIGLLLIYGGLILSGALLGPTFAEGTTRTAVLSGLSTQNVGRFWCPIFKCFGGIGVFYHRGWNCYWNRRLHQWNL